MNACLILTCEFWGWTSGWHSGYCLPDLRINLSDPEGLFLDPSYCLKSFHPESQLGQAPGSALLSDPGHPLHSGMQVSDVNTIGIGRKIKYDFKTQPEHLSLLHPKTWETVAWLFSPFHVIYLHSSQRGTQNSSLRQIHGWGAVFFFLPSSSSVETCFPETIAEILSNGTSPSHRAGVPCESPGCRVGTVSV